MVGITHDSELMMQHIAAVAVPNSSIFFTVRDENGRPEVFSMGTDKKFYVFKENVEGKYELIDLGSLLKLEGSYVAHALSVTQDQKSSLSIILAIENKTAKATDPNRLPSDVLVLKPFQSSAYDLGNPDSDLRGLIVPQKGESPGVQVSQFYSAGTSGGTAYPPTLVAYQPLEYLNKKEDLSRIVVSSDLTEWSFAYDIDLPEDASRILALQPLVVPFGSDSLPGLAALYIIQDTPQLIFKSTSEDLPYQMLLECPPDAQALQSLLAEDGFTDLIVGGKGLYHFKADELLRKNSEGARITEEGVFERVSMLHVAQSPSGATIWAASTNDSVGYIMLDTTSTPVKSPVTVIAKHLGGHFSVFKPDGDGQEQLIVANDAGALSLIRHDPTLGFWKPTPFYTPALEKIMDIRCYTTHISVVGDNKKPYINSDVILRASGYIDIIVNGVSIEVSPLGTPVVTDQDGFLTLIVPTEGISSYTFTVSTPDDTAGDSDAPLVDPTARIYTTLSKIQSGDDLKNATLQDGQKLLPDDKFGDEDLEQVAKAISACVSARQDVLKKPTTFSREKALLTGSQPIRYGKNFEKLINGRGLFDDFIDMVEDGWNWFVNALEDVTAWVIETVGDVVSFLVELGGKVYRWTLNTLEMIGNALTWIFEKVLEIVETIIQWIGFIFNWGDIKATHASIVSLTNNALNVWAEKADLAPAAIDNYFGGLADMIKGSGNALPDKIGSAPANPETADSSRAGNDAANSTKVKWSQYQCTHGGAIKGSVITSSDGSSMSFDEFWTDVIAPFINTFASAAQDVGEAIFAIFNPADSITPSEALSKLGTDLLLDLLNGAKSLAQGLAKLGSNLLKDFKAALNYKITIPVFSALYEWISGAELTVLDGLSLVLAIPVTIFTKIVTGATPPDMTQIGYQSLVDGTATPEQRMQFNHFASSTTICSRPIMSAIEAITTVLGVNMRFETSRMKHLAKRPRKFAPRKQPMASTKDLAKKYWQDVFAVVAIVSTVPYDPDLPAYGLRWGSWTVCALQQAVDMALRRVTGEATMLQKGLGLGKMVLGSINYSLVIATKVEEWKAEHEQDDEPLIVLNCVSATFDLVSCTCDGAATMDIEPDTRAALELASLITTIFSVVVTGGVYITKTAEGDYNNLIPFV
ncbi:hypothetical protein AJ79_04709 [Helicocarpus griseus UAMH5409]|uniref:Uncharacterized protein n=1 Tax=Helicocarpus griseus UAMH5409 TaxID=1447875 RepID=A0A2B7XR43_9EURO|nr:hypothetical protein AJ79_04709 [Helicocarpus griseus UAMH5409]